MRLKKMSIYPIDMPSKIRKIMIKMTYNVVKESKIPPKYPEIIGFFEDNSDAITMMEKERLKMENTKFSFYIKSVKNETGR